jgi:L-aminopeptidase/D-esterase-like protein
MKRRTTGPKNDITDVSGLQVGCAKDDTVVTGVTVIVPDQPATCAVAVAGGGPGTRETDLLRPDTLVQTADAVTLAGGSVHGLAAADGVVSGLLADGRGFLVSPDPSVPRAPIVPAAILFDLANGGAKAWGDVSPYFRLGRSAYLARSAASPLGNQGAGTGALAGSLKGGQGTASWVMADGTVVGALAAVNCLGSTLMPASRAFWAWPYEQAGEFGGARPDTARGFGLEDWPGSKLQPSPRGSTTIACIATDAALTQAEATRVAQMALAGMARSVRPIFTPLDGDTVFVLATGSRGNGPLGPLDLAGLGEVAAACLARAIARGVYLAEPVGPWPAYRALKV